MFTTTMHYAPIIKQFDESLIHDIDQTLFNVSSTLIKITQMLDPKYRTFLRKPKFYQNQISPQDLLNPTQLLLEFQELYLQRKCDFFVIDIPFHVKLKPDAELKKTTHHKNSSTL